MNTFPTRNALYERMVRVGYPAVEVGVWCGGNAVEILDRGKPSTLHVIDPWCNRDTKNSHKSHQGRMNHAVGRLANAIALGRVIVHIGFSSGVLPLFPSGYFGFGYIDGAHDYPSVLDDLVLCSRAVAPNGVIAGHDLQRQEVAAAVRQFCDNTDWEMTSVTEEESPSFALERP